MKRFSRELVFSRFTILAINFATFPIVLNQLGLKEFGLYLLLSNLVLIGAFSDLGIGNFAINYLIKDSPEKIQDSTIRNITYSTFISGSVFATLGILIAIHLPLNSLFSVPKEFADDFKVAIFVALVGYAFIPLSTLPNKVFLSRSQNRISSLYSLISAVVTNILLIFFVFIDAQLWILVAVQTFVPISLAVPVIKYRILSNQKLIIFDSEIGLNKILKNIKNASPYLILQFSAIISYQADVWIVSYFLGPEQVTIFSTTWKICSLPILILSTGYLPSWQVTRELDIKGKSELAFQALIKTLKRVISLVGAFAIVVTVFGNIIIRLWTNNSVKVEISLIICCCLWVLIYAISLPIAYYLNGLQENRFNVVSAISNMIANVMISVYLTRELQSPVGPLIGSCLAQLAFVLFPFLVLHKRILTRHAPKSNLSSDEVG